VNGLHPATLFAPGAISENQWFNCVFQAKWLDVVFHEGEEREFGLHTAMFTGVVSGSTAVGLALVEVYALP